MTSSSDMPDSPTSDPIRIAVIGYGYWGPNLVRNFSGCLLYTSDAADE